MRVADFLTEQQVPFETLLHPPAFTAQKRAKYLGLSGRQVAKSVLLCGPRGFVMAVLPAPRHVDTAQVAEALGGPVRLATDSEIQSIFGDCEWGVVPPFGSLYDLPVLLDSSISPETLMVFETNVNALDVRLCCRDFERLEHPRRFPLSR